LRESKTRVVLTFMNKKIYQVVCLAAMVILLESCSDLIAKQKAIRSVQNYHAGKSALNFKSWLEDRIDAHDYAMTWEAGRLKKGLWIVQIFFKAPMNEEVFLYLVDLETGQIRGADSGLSQETLRDFEKSAPEYI
jgi:hypothetical protein